MCTRYVSVEISLPVLCPFFFSFLFFSKNVRSSKVLPPPPTHTFPGIFTAFDCRAAIKIRKRKGENISGRNKPNPNLGSFFGKITRQNDDKRKRENKVCNTFLVILTKFARRGCVCEFFPVLFLLLRMHFDYIQPSIFECQEGNRPEKAEIVSSLVKTTRHV